MCQSMLLRSLWKKGPRYCFKGLTKLHGLLDYRYEINDPTRMRYQDTQADAPSGSSGGAAIKRRWVSSASQIQKGSL
jgi:hypothetical protein